MGILLKVSGMLVLVVLTTTSCRGGGHIARLAAESAIDAVGQVVGALPKTMLKQRVEEAIG